MGNFLFQSAACIGYALKHGLEFSLPNFTNSEVWNPIYLQHLVNPKWVQGLQDVIVDEQKEFVFNEIEFNESWRNKQIVLNGYWQNEKYFCGYRNELLYLFNFPYEYKPICSVHARYGDYLEIEGKHIIIDEDYLKTAIKYMVGTTGIDRFKVFSDDLKTFKSRLGHCWNFEYSTNTTETDDLIEMSCCAFNINSSSTFSWWAAWLNQNENKVVTTPQRWFQDGWQDSDTSISIVPKTWIKL